MKTFKAVGFESEGYVVYTFLQDDDPQCYATLLITPDGVIAAGKNFATRAEALLSHEDGIKAVLSTVETLKAIEHREAPQAKEAKPKRPSLATLERWANEGRCKTPDGCWVEPDGSCQHGQDSWLIVLGYV
jgi:hypothetical protein